MVLIETVGVGQSEIEVASVVDVVVLVLQPGSGDSVQALKAGVMEIPDIICINKKDHPEAKAMRSELRHALSLTPAGLRPTVVETDARSGEGIAELWAAVEERRALLGAEGLEARRRASLERELRTVAVARAAVRHRAHAARARDRPGAPARGPRRRPPGRGRRAVRGGVRGRAPVGVTTLDDIRRAADVVYDVAVRTPVLGSRHLGARTGGTVHLKAENLQRTGSFKIRGAYNRISALSDDERPRGVVAASAGNHAQGVALAARLLGVPATIFMPVDASIAKIEATARLRRHGRAERRDVRRVGQPRRASARRATARPSSRPSTTSW